MTIVRLGDGRLVFHNAIPLTEEALAQVKAWGKPSMLIVPIHLHTIDAHAFREKLGLAVFTSKAVVDRVRSVLPVDGVLEDLPGDPSLSCHPLAGTRFGEAAWTVRSGPRVSLLLCDAVQNSRPGRGWNGLMFRLMGFTGEDLKTPPFYKLRAVTDRAALKSSLLRLAETPDLARIVPSHGDIVASETAASLRKAVDRYL
jgi:hypothetical protein